VIAGGLTAAQVWPWLVDVARWETYYSNVAQITPPATGSRLGKGDAFSFSTFGLPPLSCSCEESEMPADGNPGRLAWQARLEGDENTAISVYHAWIVEDLDEGRVRILTQESQIGKPAAQLAVARPNPMLNAHQDWLEGLLKMARTQE